MCLTPLEQFCVLGLAVLNLCTSWSRISTSHTVITLILSKEYNPKVVQKDHTGQMFNTDLSLLLQDMYNSRELSF